MKENVESVFQWCSITIDFFLTKEPDFVFMKELKLTLSSLSMKENMKELRALKKEIEVEFIPELSEMDRKELAVLLDCEKQQLSFDISSEIKSIIDRGHIVGDDEYVVLTNYVDSAGLANVGVINQMLIEYYNNKK